MSAPMSVRFRTALSVLVGVDSAVPSIFLKVPGEEKEMSIAELAVEFESLWQEASSSGCISRNETVDDIATKDLKYALLPYYESCALSRHSGSSAQHRAAVLEMSKKLLVEFMDLVRQLGLMEAEEIARAEKEFPSDPGARRMAKIEKLKREKEERTNLHAMKIKAASASEDESEQLEREVILAVIRVAAMEAADLRRIADEELELLNFAVESRESGKDPVEEARKAISQLPPPPTYQVLDTRKYQQENVFKPSHSLPTYTVEEWGEVEMARMQEQSRREAEQRKQAEAEAALDSDEDDVSDRKTMEARHWDDWTDDNNKGSGNTLR